MFNDITDADNYSVHTNQDGNACVTFTINAYDFYCRPSTSDKSIYFEIFHMPHSNGMCPVCGFTHSELKKCLYKDFLKNTFQKSLKFVAVLSERNPDTLVKNDNIFGD